MGNQGADVLFQEFDTDNSNFLSLEEFQQLVPRLQKQPQIFEWAKTLGLPEVLADTVHRNHGSNALRVVSERTDAECENVIGALHDGLHTLLRKSAHELLLCLICKRKAVCPKQMVDRNST